MSLLRFLFGRGGKQTAEQPAKQAEHKGFVVEARPFKEGGRYQTAGLIAKEIDGVRKEFRFIRADSFTTLEEAADLALSKGRLIVDEQGERMFEGGETKGDRPAKAP
jgi:hypothetical protein